MVVDVIRITGLCHHDQPAIECQLHEALHTHRLYAFITWERGNAPSISALVPAPSNKGSAHKSSIAVVVTSKKFSLSSSN